MSWRTRVSFVCAAASSLLLTSCEIILVEIDWPLDYGTVISSTVPFSFSISGARGAVTYSCQLDSEPERPCEPDIEYTEVADGEHTLTVNVVDASDRRGTKTRRFTVNTRNTTPKVTIDSPSPGAYIQSAEVTVGFSVLRPLAGDTFLCGLDGQPRVPCSSPHVFSNVPDGLHTVTVSANSPLGFSTFDRVQVVVDGANSQPPLQIRQVSAGGSHTCALFVNGAVRCWGDNSYGQLGYGNHDVDPTRLPDSRGNVNVGGEVIQIAAGGTHTCALLRGGSVRCWGNDTEGQLGYAFAEPRWIGGEEPPASAGDVNVGGSVTQISAGGAHTCALLSDGAVRCWGNNARGALGYGHTEQVGKVRVPAAESPVNVGGRVAQIATGSDHTCALLSDGAVRCWGTGFFGALGYGNQDDIGDDEAPAVAGDVSVGAPVTQLAAGSNSTCALLASGQVRCWGWEAPVPDSGVIWIGDDELPSSIPPVNVGGTVTALSVREVVCARLDTGAVRCWGSGSEGQLGYERPGFDQVAYSEVAERGDVRVGAAVQQISVGGAHVCAITESNRIRCWGSARYGALGYGNTENIGDDEPPSRAGEVLVGFPL